MFIIGQLQVEKDTALRVKLPNDFTAFYLWLIKRRFFGASGAGYFDNRQYQTQRHGAHVTVALRTIHGWNNDWNKIKSNPVRIDYCPETLQVGGCTKLFRNYWMCADSDDIVNIKRDLNIIDSDRFLGLHITVCSNKNEINNLSSNK